MYKLEKIDNYIAFKKHFLIVITNVPVATLFINQAIYNILKIEGSLFVKYPV